jgi:hypothetical protein
MFGRQQALDIQGRGLARLQEPAGRMRERGQLGEDLGRRVGFPFGDGSSHGNHILTRS